MPDFSAQGSDLARQQTERIENVAKYLAKADAAEKMSGQCFTANRFARRALVDLKEAMRLEEITDRAQARHEETGSRKPQLSKTAKIEESLQKAADKIEMAKKSLLTLGDPNSPNIKVLEETELLIKEAQKTGSIPKQFENTIVRLETTTVNIMDDSSTYKYNARDWIAKAREEVGKEGKKAAQQLEKLLQTRTAQIEEQLKTINRLRLELLLEKPTLDVGKFTKLMSEISSSGDREAARWSEQLMVEFTRTKKIHPDTLTQWMMAHGSTTEEIAHATQRFATKSFISKIHNPRTLAAAGVGTTIIAGAGWFVKKNIDWAKEREAYEQRIRELQEALLPKVP